MAGSPGDVRPVGAGVSELRVNYGPGYRVYYLQQGQRLILLLCGGDKSTQGKDIEAALVNGENPERRTALMSEENAVFTPYDTADYLTSREDAAAYLEAVMEEAGDDPAFIAQALGTIARSGNLSELARNVGMSREGLYKALSSDGNPSFATISKVARALGLRIHFEAVA